MATGSQIEWTEATWNPTTGCTKISPGCKNCYAETLTKRLEAMGQKKYRQGFKYVEHEKDIDIPLKWKKPRRIFVNSMSDLFHEESDFEFTGRCFHTMCKAGQHDYQILTKRPHRMAEFSELFSYYFKKNIPNYIWMGTSIESAKYTKRIDDLRKVRCATRFISFEPLIGAVGKVNLEEIDWVIIGGESGAGYRPIKKEWVEEIIQQCVQQKVAVFFKQWGGFRPKSGGRTINGRQYDEYPEIGEREVIEEGVYNRKEFADMCMNYNLENNY